MDRRTTTNAIRTTPIMGTNRSTGQRGVKHGPEKFEEKCLAISYVDLRKWTVADGAAGMGIL